MEIKQIAIVDEEHDMTWKDVYGITMSLLLELYGTVNFYGLQVAFHDFCSHLTYWHYSYMEETCTKWHFVCVAVDMIGVMENLCSRVQPNVVDYVLRRLELEDVLEPRGLLQTLFEIAIIRKCFQKCFQSRAELLAIFKSCERAQSVDEIQVPRNHNIIANRLWVIHEVLVFEFAYDVINVLFNKRISNPQQTNGLLDKGHDKTQTKVTCDENNVADDTQAQPAQMEGKIICEKPTNIINSDCLQRWVQNCGIIIDQNQRADKRRLTLLIECGCTLQTLAHALAITDGAKHIQSVRKNKVLDIMQYRQKQMNADTTFASQFLIVQNLYNAGVTLSDIAKYIKIPTQKQFLFRLCVQVTLFLAKLKHRVRIHRAGLTVVATRTLHFGVLCRMIHWVVKLRMRMYKQRDIRKQKKLVKKERVRQLRKTRNMLATQRIKTQQLMRTVVLPELMRNIITSTITTKQQCLSIIIKKEEEEEVVNKKKDENDTVVTIHKSTHTITGIVYFWRKLGRLQAIKRTMLETPRLISNMCEKVEDFRVRQYLFACANSDGNTLYWEFRFALYMLSKIQAECCKIIDFLRSTSPTKAPFLILNKQSQLITTLMNPFTTTNQITMCTIAAKTARPMVKLAKHLQKDTFVENLRAWIRSDPNICAYETCLSLFYAQLDIFDNMKRCFKRIPFACQKMLWSLYYAHPKYIDASGAYTYHNCKDYYPRFKGIWEIVQGTQLSQCVDHWLETGFYADILQFLRISANAEKFVAEIEEDKPNLKQKLKQRLSQLRHK